MGDYVASQPACFLLVPFRHAGDALTPGVILRYLSQRPFLVCLMAVGTYVAVVTTGHCLGPFVIAHRDMAHQSGPDIVADESCFDGQRVRGPSARRWMPSCSFMLKAPMAGATGVVRGPSSATAARPGT
ncbi:hypothetical protein RAA17_01790 [Komagataeibacter rhaeticus]|nr:hypothetical protein [Komagataeibacter rhaeticus]